MHRSRQEQDMGWRTEEDLKRRSGTAWIILPVLFVVLIVIALVVVFLLA